MTVYDEVRSNVHSVNSGWTEALDKAKVVTEITSWAARCRENWQLHKESNRGVATQFFDWSNILESLLCRVQEGLYDLPAPSTADLVEALKGREVVETESLCLGEKVIVSHRIGERTFDGPATILIVPKEAP